MKGKIIIKPFSVLFIFLLFALLLFLWKNLKKEGMRTVPKPCPKRYNGKKNWILTLDEAPSESNNNTHMCYYEKKCEDTHFWQSETNNCIKNFNTNRPPTKVVSTGTVGLALAVRGP